MIGAPLGSSTFSGQGHLVFGVPVAIPGLVIANSNLDASGLTAGGIAADLRTGQLTLGALSIRRNIANCLNVSGTQYDNLVTGNDAANSLVGHVGNDVLTGGGGQDRLVGGEGSDILTGGLEADQFVFDTNARFNRATIGIDTIIDFTPGTDKITLDRTTFKLPRKVYFDSVRNLAQAKSSDAVITYIRSTGALFYNQNAEKRGFGTGGQFADLANGLNLAARDILIQA